MQWPELAGELGVPLRLCATREPVSLDALSPAERARMPGGLRRHDWLLGRAALRGLLGGADTSQLRFPDRCVSLTHASGLAVAARAGGGQAGVGVDYEGPSPPDPRTARLFLGDGERALVREEDLLRLWTVKEALFKATPGNAGASFVDNEATDPRALAGTATGPGGRTFRYASRFLDGGWLTVAVCHAAG